MKQSWISALCLLAVPGVYYVAVGRGHVAEIDRLHREIGGWYEEAAPAEGQAAQLPELKRTVEQLESWREELRRKLLRDSTVGPLLLTMSAALRRFGLEVDHAEILADEPMMPLSSQRLHVVVSGSFPRLFEFIHHIEASEPPSRVTSLDVRPTSVAGQVRVDLSLTGFWTEES